MALTTPRATILMIAGRQEMLATAAELTASGYAVSIVSDADAALRAVNSNRFQSVLLDLDLAGKNDLSLVEAIAQSLAAPSLVVCAAEASLEFAVAVMRMGASDFVTGPPSAARL